MTSLLPRIPFTSIVLIFLVGMAAPVRASNDPAERVAAARLVQAQLPDHTSLSQADGATLARAVSQATLEHRAQAPTILLVALTGSVSETNSNPKKIPKRSADFVVRVFKAALLAAPEEASKLTEVVVTLYPEYADETATILQTRERRVAAYDYKDRADYKDRGDYKDRADYKDTASAPVAGINNLGDPEVGLSDSFGFGPGFPGSPGFVGSPPSGGFALPPVALPTPGTAPVTAVVNE